MQFLLQVATLALRETLALTELEQVDSHSLILCVLGNFLGFCCRLLTFFIINFFEKFFQEHYQSVKQFGSRSGPMFCWS